MRKIKYKIWDKKDCKFLPEKDLQKFSINALKANGIDFVFLQWIGLLDKDDREIYEGDIVSDPYYNKLVGFIKYMPHCVFVVKRFKGTTWHDISASKEKGKKWKSYYEIIGNIYENPRLLEDN